MKAREFYLFSGIIILVLFVFGIFLCITAGWTWIHISFCVLSLIFGIGTILLRDAGYCYAIILGSAILRYALPMSNIIPFFLLALIMLQRPKWKYHLLLFYAINLLIACILMEAGILIHCPNVEGPGVVHLAINMTLTLFFFVSIAYFISTKFSRKELDLTDDEITILEELRKEKMLKNCKSFSKNTLTQKLKEARDRNHIETNAELMAQYCMRD